MLVVDLNNNQSRKLAWMRDECWEWHLIHTDTFACTEPLFGCLEIISKFMKTNFGNNVNEQCPQGPPSK